MPWQEALPMDLRMRFVTDWHTGFWTVSELCREYRVSRKTGYKWLDRHERAGAAGLADRSRRPRTSPRALPEEVASAILRARAQHPSWGARKLLAWLRRREPAQIWPGRTTVCDLLTRHGLVRERQWRAAAPRQGAPFAAVAAPNDTWTVDFKGQFRTRDAALCFPLTMKDAFSRFVVGCDALRSVHGAPVRARMTRAFATFGLPRVIRTDNGAPFAGIGLAGLSRLSVWWIRLGITPERIDPGRPQQNGSHEQFHAVLRRETACPPAAGLASQQRRFVRFVAEYNDERPHEALQDATPASCYTQSPRLVPVRLAAPDYPGHFEVRRVFSNGTVSWHNDALFVTGVLAGEDVGFEPVNDGLWTIHFGHVVIGRYDERERLVYSLEGDADD